MKKLLALFLIGTLFCGACARSGGDIPIENGVQDRTENGPGQEQVKDPEQTDISGQAIPLVTVENVHLERYTEDGEVLLSEIYMDNMTLEGEGYEKAAETVRRLFYSDEEEMRQTVDAYAEMAKEQYEFQKDDGWFSGYMSTTYYQITRLDTRILSVNGSSYDYSGGAHGYGADWGTTIDLESGNELEISRLAKDAPAFMDKATELLLADLGNKKEELSLFDDYESYVRENVENVNWYMDASGIVFVFTPYEIGPYATGNITVCVPYEEVGEYMKEEYLSPKGEYVMLFPTDIEVPGEDGNYSVMIERRQLQEYMDETVLRVNGNETVIGENIYVVQAYLMRRSNGRSFLIFYIDWASDDYETFVYELTPEGAVQTASVPAALDGKNMNPEELKLDFALYVLGTYHSWMRYALGEDGNLTALDDIYRIESNMEWKGLVVTKELPVTVDGQEITLPVGSRLHVTATDNDSTVWFEGEDASGAPVEGEIHFEWREDDFGLYIDGVSEFEYFEDIPYVG